METSQKLTNSYTNQTKVRINKSVKRHTNKGSAQAGVLCFLPCFVSRETFGFQKRKENWQESVTLLCFANYGNFVWHIYSFESSSLLFECVWLESCIVQRRTHPETETQHAADIVTVAHASKKQDRFYHSLVTANSCYIYWASSIVQILERACFDRKAMYQTSARPYNISRIHKIVKCRIKDGVWVLRAKQISSLCMLIYLWWWCWQMDGHHH